MEVCEVTVQILGGGCAKCHQLETNAREAVSQLGIDAEIAMITDANHITEMGVMITPALAVDGVVKKSGAVLSTSEIADILRAES
jgi:small redox-active disulfide protein 2